jgi:3-oxoacyl-[acyl-carrier protein] reductase
VDSGRVKIEEEIFVTEEGMNDRVVVVTGVSRQAGIGFAVARRLLEEGTRLLIHSFADHDVEQPSGADQDSLDALIARLGGLSDRLRHVDADLGEPRAAHHLIEKAVDEFGVLDAVVVNHAFSSNKSLVTSTVSDLDRAWSVNARAAVLLAQAFAEVHDDRRPDGRIVLFTSGQHLGPMPGELPYAISKGAIHQMTSTLADALAERQITVNAINPGPVDTGWPSDWQREQLRDSFPGGRWGTPDDIAGVVAWLLSHDSAWVTGQVINAEGGFRRQPRS